MVSDRGPQFTSRVWKAFCPKLNINVSLTSGYHPQSNGQVERLNQELTRFLRSYCNRNQSDWSRFLFWAEYAQNSLHKPATGITPFQCTLGFNLLYFPGQENPRNSLPSIMANSVVRRHGMRLIRIFREQSVDQVIKPIVIDAAIQITSQVNGFGCPLGTSASGYPARSSVPGTWVHSRSLDK